MDTGRIYIQKNLPTSENLISCLFHVTLTKLLEIVLLSRATFPM